MSNLTRNGIAYNLQDSPYSYYLKYGEDEKIRKILFVFSSQLNVERFKSRVNENRDKINESLSNRFKFNVKNDVLCDIKLYTTIEKRGFLIFVNGESVECLKSITLDGNKVIMKI